MWLLLACTPLPPDTSTPSTPPVRSHDSAGEDTAPGLDDARVLSVDAPVTLQCGEATSFLVEVENRGTTTWSRDAATKLGAVDGDDPVATKNRVKLPEGARVEPGDTWVFEVEVEVPADTEGAVTTDWQMVREQVHWFGEPGSASISLSCPDEEPDPIDLAEVNWLYNDISDWPVTSTLESVTFNATELCFDHDKLNEWPEYDLFGVWVTGNAWIFVWEDDHWNAAPWEWMQVEVPCKFQETVAGDHIKHEPYGEFSGWRPTSGETYWFMVSTPARHGTWTIEERSNLVSAVWP